MLNIQIKKQLGTLQLETDLQLPAQGISAIFGRSGAGKTSLVNLLSGLERPDEGLITLGERTLFDSGQGIMLPPEKRRIGYVFQDARLFPHFRVSGNLKYANRNPDPSQFDQIVRLLGLEHLLDRYPASLSGGEKQRVAIARALLSNPDMLLMDEPLASLDEPRKAEFLPYLEQLVQQIQLPVLYVSHNLEEILRLADQLVLIDSGKVVCQGPLAEVWSSPQMQPWQPDQDISTVVETHLARQHPDYPMTCLNLDNGISLWTSYIDAPLDTPVRLRIHARDISLVRTEPEQSSIRNIIPVRVSAIENPTSNDNRVIRLQAGNCELRCNITAWAADELKIKTGDSLFAQIKGMSVTRNDWISNR